jgi:hypothetical protein
MSSRFQDVAAPLSLGPLLHCRLPVAPNIYSRKSVLSRFLIQHWPCLVPNYRVPDALQEWHGGSSLCTRRSTSSGTHHRPGSVSSVLWQVSLRPLT